MTRIHAKALKLTAVVDPAELLEVYVPPGQPRIDVELAVPGRVLTASLNAKSLRRAIAAVKSGGDYAVIVQGKIGRTTAIEEAGISAQPRTPKAEAAE